MSDKSTAVLAIILILILFFSAFYSIIDDSFTFDETAHVTAGYSYLTQKDMRLNPEHPPLLKDLAAFPLLFLNLNFPQDSPSWLQEENPVWWHQFDLGNQFLYRSGNNPDQILIWSRLPMILILLLLGFFVFKWTRELFGNKAGLLALALFSLSPTLLAHGRLVTTDVGAAAGAFIATYYFIKSLWEPNWKNILIAGIALGIAELLKFSLILLIPFFITLGTIWWLTKFINFFQTVKILFLVFFVGYLLVWPVYQFHILNYPAERQLRDTEFLMSSVAWRPLANTVADMTKIPVLRPYAQYAVGLILVFQRSNSGNTTYFLGQISANGWKHYFPTVYLLKETLAFHILTLIALLWAYFYIKKPIFKEAGKRFYWWIKLNFPVFAMLVFIALYWAISLRSNLNIGVRHLLPVFPFTILLVAAAIDRWLKEPYLSLKYLSLTGLIGWQIFSVASVYPHLLAYFNELAGGPNRGYLVAVDSNLDWGQDLKRLELWMEEKKINKIYLDYFGGGDPSYYLGQKFIPWQGTKNPSEIPKGSYFAVSANFLQGGTGRPVPGLDINHGYYNWLNKYKPIAKIGYSIFVYRIN